jgi:hypothetical protein
VAVTLRGAITQVAPASGAPGTMIVIQGTGFGAGKPKVYLGLGGTRRVLRVSAYSNTRIEARVSQGVAGVYSVVVVPQGGEADVFADGFEVKAPEVASLTVVTGRPGSTFAIRGRHFGATPRVLMGGIRVRPTAVSDTEISVVVPATLANGIYGIGVRTRAGSGTLAASFTLTGSAVGVPTRDHFRATFGGERLEVPAGPLLTGSWTRVTKMLSLMAADPPASLGGSVRTFNITAFVDLEGLLPTLIDENPANPNEGLMTYQVAKLPSAIGGLPVTTVWLTRDVWEWTITINAFAGGRVVGTFTGTMRNGVTNAPMAVSGDFAVTVIVAK